MIWSFLTSNKLLHISIHYFDQLNENNTLQSNPVNIAIRLMLLNLYLELALFQLFLLRLEKKNFYHFMQVQQVICVIFST